MQAEAIPLLTLQRQGAVRKVKMIALCDVFQRVA